MEPSLQTTAVSRLQQSTEAMPLDKQQQAMNSGPGGTNGSVDGRDIRHTSNITAINCSNDAAKDGGNFRLSGKGGVAPASHQLSRYCARRGACTEGANHDGFNISINSGSARQRRASSNSGKQTTNIRTVTCALLTCGNATLFGRTLTRHLAS